MGDATRFSYYRRLNAGERRTYRKSDAVLAVELPAAPALQPRVAALRAALESGKRASVEARAQSLGTAILASLGVPPVVVRVRSVRPADHGGELHGLYTWEEGKPPLIEVWMRTAKNQDVVAFRTFLRTFLHEVCHHLDFTLLGLSDTFHTSGFFRRESSLVRQLAGSGRKRGPSRAAEPGGVGASDGVIEPKRRRRSPVESAAGPEPVPRAESPAVEEVAAPRPPRPERSNPTSQLKLFE